jgi:hypothetical protein
MGKAIKVLGWILSVLGAVSLLLSLLVVIEGEPQKRGAIFGFMMFAIMLGLPGAIILWLCRQREKAAEFERQLLGYIKSYNAFTVAELAQKIGKTELETEGLVATLIAQEQLNLGFHRQTRQYLHRSRLTTAHTCLQACPSCGAAIGTEIIFEGEEVYCQYCDQLLSQGNAPRE